MRQRTVSLWMNTEVAPDPLYYMPPITSNRSKLADFDAHIMRLEPRPGRQVPPSRNLVADRGAEAPRFATETSRNLAVVRDGTLPPQPS
jgi:hypothetical protein